MIVPCLEKCLQSDWDIYRQCIKQSFEHRVDEAKGGLPSIRGRFSLRILVILTDVVIAAYNYWRYICLVEMFIQQYSIFSLSHH